jgi:hypothetical protein
MNNQEVHQNAPVVGSNSMVPTAPTLPPNNLVHQNHQVSVQQQHFRNVQEAKNWIDRVKVPPHVDPTTDATINAVDANRQAWVGAMIDAVYDLQQCQDGAKMKGHFTPTHKSCYQDIEVEAACHVLADALIEHCRLGFRGLDKFNALNNTVARNPVDETTNCYDRANNVLIALRTWKSICKGMIEEADKKWQLVNAPLSTIKKKNTEASANTRKKVNAIAGKNARQQVTSIKQSGRVSIASPSLKATSPESSRGTTPDGFGVFQLQPAPTTHNSTAASPRNDLESAPRAISRLTTGSFGRPATGQCQAASTMRRDRKFAPHDNTDTATELVDRPSEAEYQKNSSRLRGLEVVSDELREEHPTGDFDSANPFAGLSKLSYDPCLDADALFAGGLDGFGASYSSAGLTGDAFTLFNVNSPLGAYPVGILAPNYPPVPDLPPPTYGSRPPLLQTPSHDAAKFSSVPHQSQAPRPLFTHSMHLPSLAPAATNKGENVQNNPSDFSNMADFNNVYNHNDHRNYFFGQGSLHEVTCSPSVAKSSHSAISSMGNAQPRIDAQVNNAQDVKIAPNTQAAHTSTQLPHSVHSDYAHMGSKRSREEQMNEVFLPPSSRVKRNGTGAYYFGQTVSGTGSEEEAIDISGDGENSGNPGPVADGVEAGIGNGGAPMDDDIL